MVEVIASVDDGTGLVEGQEDSDAADEADVSDVIEDEATSETVGGNVDESFDVSSEE